MKKALLFLLAFGFAAAVHAQTDYAQMDTAQMHNQPILNVDKAKYLKDVNIIANTRFAMNNSFTNGELQNSRFGLDEFRLEFVGKVGERVHFRYRQFLAGFSPDIRSRDNVRNSVDIAEVAYAFTDKFTFTVGKMLSEWGAYEFETNPIDIVDYNPLIISSDPFLTGVKFKYRAFANHAFTLQIVNTRTQSFSEAFGEVPGVEASKAPFTTNVSWRGNFAEGKFSTIWSFSNMVEAKNKNVQLIQLGNQLKLNKLQIQYDFKYSTDEIDRLGQVSMLIANNETYTTRALDAQYVEHWMRAVYFFNEKWSITGVGMIAQDFWNGNQLATINVPKDDHLRTALSYTLQLEHYLYKPQNLRLFMAYVNRQFNHTDYAKAQFGLVDSNQSQLLFGLITPLVFY